MAGRPSSFTQETADAICERLAAGESLRTICKDDGMPHAGTVCRWLADDKNVALREQYMRAREAQADTLFDEILEIADDGKNDTYQTDDGEATNHDVIARSRLRVDARKWMAGKLRPKVYGEKVSAEITGKDGAPIQILLSQLGNSSLSVKADDDTA